MNIEDVEAYINERNKIEQEYKVKNLKFFGFDIFEVFLCWDGDEDEIKIKKPCSKNEITKIKEIDLFDSAFELPAMHIMKIRGAI